MEHPRDWPSIHTYHTYRALCEGEQVEGVWIDRTSLYQAQQRAKLKCNKDKPAPTEADFSEPLILTFDGPPPLWGDLSDEAYRALCQRLADEVVQEHAEQRAKEGERVMGAEAVKHQPVMDKRFVKRSITPLYHAKCMERAREYKEAYWAFVASFKEVSHTLRSHLARTCCTLEVMFPEGGVPLTGGGWPSPRAASFITLELGSHNAFSPHRIYRRGLNQRLLLLRGYRGGLFAEEEALRGGERFL